MRFLPLSSFGRNDLRGCTFPFNVQLPPKLQAIGLAQTCPAQDVVCKNRLDALEQGVVQSLRCLGDPTCPDLLGRILKAYFALLLSNPQKEMAHIKPVAGQVPQGAISPRDIRLGLDVDIQGLVVRQSLAMIIKGFCTKCEPGVCIPGGGAGAVVGTPVCQGSGIPCHGAFAVGEPSEAAASAVGEPNAGGGTAGEPSAAAFSEAEAAAVVGEAIDWMSARTFKSS